MCKRKGTMPLLEEVQREVIDSEGTFEHMVIPCIDCTFAQNGRGGIVMHLKHKFDCVELEDKTIAVPVGEASKTLHGVVRLNDTAALIFDLLKSDISEEEIVNTIMSEYNVSQAIAQADVQKCIQVFKEKGLLA